MKRVLLASALLLPVFLLSGCAGVDPTTALAVIGLLFVLGVVGNRSDATPAELRTLGEARITVEDGRGTAPLRLHAVRADVPEATVNVTGAVRPDGTFDLGGSLADGTPVRVAGRSGEVVTFTLGAKTSSHTSLTQ